MNESPVSPVGLMLAAIAAVGGWGIGAAIGHGVKQGDVFIIDAPGETTDLQEFTAFVGLVAGCGVTAKVTAELVNQYGWPKLGLYSVGWLAAVAAGRAIRSRF